MTEDEVGPALAKLLNILVDPKNRMYERLRAAQSIIKFERREEVLELVHQALMLFSSSDEVWCQEKSIDLAFQVESLQLRLKKTEEFATKREHEQAILRTVYKLGLIKEGDKL